jgi:hypothetical protein
MPRRAAASTHVEDRAFAQARRYEILIILIARASDQQRSANILMSLIASSMVWP